MIMAPRSMPVSGAAANGPAGGGADLKARLPLVKRIAALRYAAQAKSVARTGAKRTCGRAVPDFASAQSELHRVATKIPIARAVRCSLCSAREIQHTRVRGREMADLPR